MLKPMPFAVPDLGEEEISAVADVVRSGWVTSGSQMRAFETEFADYVGGDVQAIAVNSATAGLHLALDAMGIGPGDEVIVPDWTFTATAAVVCHVGATPIIVDVDRDTLNMDLEAMAAALTERTKAIIVVHFTGLPLDLKAVRAAIGDREIALIEDAAHALPATGTSGRVGSCADSDVAVFSFGPIKTITTGEGGMICTRHADIAEKCRLMRLHGIDRDAFDRYTSSRPSWFYDVIAPGYKYNMTDISAAIGRVQLRRAESMRLRREEIANYYISALGDQPIVLPPAIPSDWCSAWHLFVLRLRPDGVDRNQFIGSMAEQGIGTSVHFIPLHRHDQWKSHVSPSSVPVAESQADLALSIPMYSRMTDEQVERVAAAVINALG